MEMNHWERVKGMHAAYAAVISGARPLVCVDHIGRARVLHYALMAGVAVGAGGSTDPAGYLGRFGSYATLATREAQDAFREQIFLVLCLGVKLIRFEWSDLDPDDAYLAHIYDHRMESDREFLGETVFGVEASPGWRELFPGFTEDVWFRETPGGIQVLKEDDLDDIPEPDEEGARLDRIDDDERDREHFGR